MSFRTLLASDSSSHLMSSLFKKSYCPVSGGATSMSRISRTCGLSMLEIAALNFISSLVIRAVLNCASSVINHNATSSAQSGGTRSRVFTASTLPIPVIVLPALSVLIIATHFIFALMFEIAFSRIPLFLDHVGVTNFVGTLYIGG